MASTSEKIVDDLKQAMKNRDETKKRVLKSLKAALDKERIDGNEDLDDAAEIKIIATQHKQRIEAAEIYAKNEDVERANAETAEAKIITSYLPQQLDEAEIDKHIDSVCTELGACSIADMGKVMGKLTGIFAGKADMKLVSQKVRSRLSG